VESCGLAHGQFSLLARASGQLITLLRRRHVFKDKNELLAVLGKVGVPAMGGSDLQCGRQHRIEVNFSSVDTLRDCRRAADGVDGRQFEHHAVRPLGATRSVLKAQSNILTHLPGTDAFRGEIVDLQALQSASMEGLCEPLGSYFLYA
jgi:hypothetical protein